MKTKTIALVGAMDSEIVYIKKCLQENGKVKEKNINGFTFFEGKIENKKIILVKSGVGRCASSILFTTMVTYYKNIDLVINIGIAGGYKGMNPLDIVIGEKTVYGDVDISIFPSYVYGQMASCPAYFEAPKDLIDKIIKSSVKCKVGCICTNEKFMTDYDLVKGLVDENFKDLNVLAFDMESAAFAQTAYHFNIPFISIRAISDVIGDSKQIEKYEDEFEEKASLQSNIFTMDLLKII